jgi:hypothetical protein
MPNETNNLYDDLKKLIEDSRNRELECRAYLKYARDLLVDVTTASFYDEEKEYRGHSGDSDYLVVCRVIDGAGIEEIKSYIWEVKAPQCCLFEYDTKNRVKPTKEYISAENQLLHYYEESKGSTQFRNEFRITHPENVKLGGLIIGSKKTWVKGKKYDSSTSSRLFRRALDLRRMYLYGNSGIKIIVWDRILDYFLEKETMHPADVKLKSSISIPQSDYSFVSSSGSIISSIKNTDE